MVGATGGPAQVVGQGGQHAVGRVLPEGPGEPLEPVELDDHDRRRPAVALDPGRLVGDDPVPLAGQEEPGQRIGPWRREVDLAGCAETRTSARTGRLAAAADRPAGHDRTQGRVRS